MLHSLFSGSPCGRPTESACRPVTHSNSVPVGSEHNNGLVWLMGERNHRQSFISMSYYRTVYSLSHTSLGLKHNLPTIVHSDSNQLPHPRPPVNVQFKYTHTHGRTRTPAFQCIHMRGRERSLNRVENLFGSNECLPGGSMDGC